MKQTAIQKASNNLEFREKIEEYETIKEIYKIKPQTQYRLLKQLIKGCLFMANERRFTQLEKDCFGNLAINISEYIKKQFSRFEFDQKIRGNDNAT